MFTGVRGGFPCWEMFPSGFENAGCLCQTISELKQSEALLGISELALIQYVTLDGTPLQISSNA